MKKTLITISILAGMTSATTNAAQLMNDGNTSLHGRAQGMYYVSDDKDQDGDQSFVRVGLDGKSNINEDLYAFGFYEFEYMSNTRTSLPGDEAEDDAFDIRRAYAGFGTKYGEFSYGRQYGAVTLVSDYTDIYYEFGNSAAGVSTDLFGTGRSDSVLKYAFAYDGLNLHMSYQAENDKVSTDASAYGLAADYAFPFGLKVALGYNKGDGVTGGEDAELLIGALSYRYEGLYMAVLYSDGENWGQDGTEKDTDYEGLEAVITYELTDKLSTLVGYNNLEKESTETVDYYTLGFEYVLNANFKSLAEYKFNEIDNKDDVLALAVRYSF